MEKWVRRLGPWTPCLFGLCGIIAAIAWSAELRPLLDIATALGILIGSLGLFGLFSL